MLFVATRLVSQDRPLFRTKPRFVKPLVLAGAANYLLGRHNDYWICVHIPNTVLHPGYGMVSFILHAGPMHTHTVLGTSSIMCIRCCYLFVSGGIQARAGSTTSLYGEIRFTSNSAERNGGTLIGLLQLAYYAGSMISPLRVYTPAIIGKNESSVNTHNSFVRHVRDPKSEFCVAIGRLQGRCVIERIYKWSRVRNPSLKNR